MTRTALVSGASIAGLTTAYWLSRTGWDVEVVERFDQFRAGGQNVDVRGAAHAVIAKMGITAQVRANNTTEEGTSYVGERGQVLGGIPAGLERDGPTAELEILRGDLAKIILDALPTTVTVRYGDRISHLENHDTTVSAEFASGTHTDYDLVVIAEGVRSRTRDLVFGDQVDKRELGLQIAYGTIPRTADDDRWWRWFTAPGRRGITLRPDNVGTTRATLAYIDRSQSISELSVEEAKQKLAQVFADAGWEASRVIAGFAQSSDVYMDSLTQIRMRHWSQGRVVVVGDAAWCVTPLGGGGTAIALTGGYVLAAYLSQADAGDYGDALRRFEQWMRPLVSGVQDLPKGMPDLFYPNSRVGVAILRGVQRALTAKPFRKIGASFAHVAQTDQQLPEIQIPSAA